MPMEPYEPSTGVTTVIVEEFHHKDKYLSTFRLNPGHFFLSLDPGHVSQPGKYQSIFMNALKKLYESNSFDKYFHALPDLIFG